MATPLFTFQAEFKDGADFLPGLTVLAADLM
jgi:hypothetical protein